MPGRVFGMAAFCFGPFAAAGAPGFWTRAQQNGFVLVQDSALCSDRPTCEVET